MNIRIIRNKVTNYNNKKIKKLKNIIIKYKIYHRQKTYKNIKILNNNRYIQEKILKIYNKIKNNKIMVLYSIIILKIITFKILIKIPRIIIIGRSKHI